MLLLQRFSAEHWRSSGIIVQLYIDKYIPYGEAITFATVCSFVIAVVGCLACFFAFGFCCPATWKAIGRLRKI